MSDDARRGYTMLARLFLIVGGVFALLAVVQIAGGFRLFNGNPLGVALIVLVIGVLLEWTVRTAPPPSAAPDEPADGEPADGAALDEPMTYEAPGGGDGARKGADPGPRER
jgi:hypothetical protein